jgi:photosystem II stability/assembly factor-like uncharacterized protein
MPGQEEMQMSERLLVATRKGLFMLQRGEGWQITNTALMGDPVSMVLHDPRSDTLFAALNLGHFGVKLHRSRDGGTSWQEIAAPSYPPQPEGAEGPAWSLVQIWCLETGGDDQPGLLWAGTMPGGLFRSEDHGESWTLVRSLWDRPERSAARQVAAASDGKIIFRQISRGDQRWQACGFAYRR